MPLLSVFPFLVHHLPAPPKVTGYQGFSLNFQVGKTTARIICGATPASEVDSRSQEN